MMKTDSPSLQVYKASIFYFKKDPHPSPDDSYVFHKNGFLAVQEGLILACEDIQKLDSYQQTWEKAGKQVLLHDLAGRWIFPGFVDAHTHYPQTDMIASPAPSLLSWLEKYTFPEEAHFHCSEHASEVSSFFLDRLLANGTTTALVWSTVHASSVEAFFKESEKRNLRMITGKVLMDQNCPSFLKEDPHKGARESEELLKAWHGKARLSYAISPRFAITSTARQLALAGELADSYPAAYVQTHLAENQREVAWVKELYPHARSYLDVYARHDLLRSRTVLGHSIWIDDRDRDLLKETGAAIATCPSANAFLGSGLFDWNKAVGKSLPIAMGSDVGAGTSFSMFSLMNESYKAGSLKDHFISGLRLFYYATLGGARALLLEDKIGNFEEGKEADFVVLNPQKNPLLERRMRKAQSLEEVLFLMATLGGECIVERTFTSSHLACS